MTWQWKRLSDEVRRLKLPSGEYAVGRVGYGLSRDSSSTADRVELLVSETGWRRLKERGWQERRASTILRHPKEHDLTARVVTLEGHRHEIVEVDGVSVIAVEPDPPAPPPKAWRQWCSTAITGVALSAIAGVMAYGAFVVFAETESGVAWDHLKFRTSKVEATVVDWDEIGTCNGAKAYENSPRIEMTLTWMEDGQLSEGDYTGCGSAVNSPQDIWVTADGEVASQHSPLVDHFWPALASGIIPFAFFVMPLFDHLRKRRWRREPREDQVIQEL